MKKFNLFVSVMLLLSAIALPACAEATVPGNNAFFDWSYLATYSGAVAAVVFIVQFLKSLYWLCSMRCWLRLRPWASMNVRLHSRKRKRMTN